MTDTIQSQASVVVIGGGVMGCSTLYHLAKQGITDAILVERNQLTSGTTWHSAAQVRALRSSRNLTDLIKYSISLYAELEAETGQQTGWINKGSISIATNEDRMVHIKRQHALAQLFGVRTETICAEEARERWPLMNTKDVVGAVWSPDDGRISPSDLCAALVKGAKSRGAKIYENTDVIGFETCDNRISGVRTSRGDIKCDAVALCAGLWSRETAALSGVEVPVWPCEHFYLLTKPVEGISGNLPTLSDHDGHLYIRDDSGGLLVGCFEPVGKAISSEKLGKDFAFQLLPEDWEHFEPMMINALHRLPALETAEVKMLLNGPESFTPDGSFLLGEAAETRGLFLGCGMNSVGVATGGGAGMALAHCIEHGHTPYDLHEADPKRFASEFNNVSALTNRVPEVLGKHYEITFPGRQWISSRNLRASPLFECWLEDHPHFGQFGPWERPLYFGKVEEPNLTFGRPDWHEQVKNEVLSAHRSAALFDQSTFGKIDVIGKDAEKFLNRICANKMHRPPGSVIYTAMLNERGGFESDLTAIRMTDDHYRLYVGTTALKKDLCWLRGNTKPSEMIELRDVTRDFAVIGLMGPDAGKIATATDAENLYNLRFFQSVESEIAGCKVLVARLSYVGEAGWEITCSSTDAVNVYRALATVGAKPAGLFAQTSMRIEKKFLAMGHELDADINPIEAGLDFAIDWSKSFVGKEALLKRRDQGSSNRIVSLQFEDKQAVPLGNEPVSLNGSIVGKTTSAAYGFRVDSPVAIADLSEKAAVAEGARVNVDIAGQQFDATVSLTALFDATGKRMRP